MAGVVYLPVGKYAHGWRLSGLRPDTPPATAHKSGMPHRLLPCVSGRRHDSAAGQAYRAAGTIAWPPPNHQSSLSKTLHKYGKRRAQSAS